MTEPLPDRPSRRRVLVVLDSADVDRLVYEGWGDLGSRADVAVVDADVADLTTDPVLASLELRGLLVPGNMLVQNPYRTDDYEPYDEGAADQFALEKFVIFTRLCQYLGAKAVSVLAIENAETGEKVSLSGKGGRGPIAAEAAGTLSSLERFAHQLLWNDVYTGGPANLSAAADLLKEHAVDSDAVLRSLVESRRYDANPHRERELVVDLSSESSRTLDVALSINIPAILKTQGKFGRSMSKQASYKVTYKVVFP